MRRKPPGGNRPSLNKSVLLPAETRLPQDGGRQ
jgi:hypothetical protein